MWMTETTYVETAIALGNEVKLTDAQCYFSGYSATVVLKLPRAVPSPSLGVCPAVDGPCTYTSECSDEKCTFLFAYLSVSP